MSTASMSCYPRLTDPHDRRAALVTVTDGGRQLVLERQDRVALPVINVLIHIEDVEAARGPTPG